MGKFVRWFGELGLDDIATVGGKNASLGELVREVGPLGIRVPNGFAIVADGYWHLVDRANLRSRLRELLAPVDKRDVDDLHARASEARRLIQAAGIPDDLWNEITTAYDRLCAEAGGRTDVAIRSSATAEDLPTASFAGQQESFLNVRGHDALREACLGCFASLFTDRAVAYRLDQGFDHLQVALSIGVQRMVRSDAGSAGVIFTLDPETGFRDLVVVTAAWGLGENVVKGSVDPDEFCVFKPTLALGRRPIVRRRLGKKQLRLVYGDDGSTNATRNIPVPDVDRRRFCIGDDDVLELARQATMIEAHYSRRAGKPTPMDIEWAKDGLSGEIFVVQARPETVESQRAADVLERHVLEEHGPVLVMGASVGQKIGSGMARVIEGQAQMATFADGEVLVAESTSPDWEPVMKRAAGIVTSRGGRTCHAAIVARELGIPAVVGAEGATHRICTGQVVTVSCAEGATGYVYMGYRKHRVDKVRLTGMERPRTKIMMNLADPGRAFALAALPNDGVGLARIEFIVNNTIKVHPMALLHPERVSEPRARAIIGELCAGYADKAEYFVDRLAQGVGTIAAAFWPKPVIVRLSDFKSNEYACLVGGAEFEPKEENPMLGLRGAARYYHPSYREAFALECRALQRVRLDMGLTNVRVMVPFCRRVEEGERVLAEMAKHGLVRGEAGLEVYVMCEIPNNVLRIDEFCRLFDGISIGSNDLTQLTLGVDRDSALVAAEFDERDPGVLSMLRMAIEGARRSGRHSGICGQAPSDHPDVAELLVRWGIDSISLNPDTVLPTTLRILEVERALSADVQQKSELGGARRESAVA